MPDALFDIHALLPAFALVLCRVSGLMISAPLYGSKTIPMQVKVLFILGLSAATFPVVASTLPPSLTLPVVIASMAGELTIGVVLGLGMNLILIATQFTGMIVGQQAGLALANVFDPNTEVQSSVIGQIYFFTATAIFLLLGGHRALMEALLDSFTAVPPMTFSMHISVVNVLAELANSSLVMAFKLAAPAVIALLVAKVSIGFLSRTLPQLHILSVGFALFVFMGMLLSGLQMNTLAEVLEIYMAEALTLTRAALGID